MRSDMIKVGVDKAPARGLLYATGQVKSAKDMQKPFIAICNSYIDIVPGHVHLRELADVAKEAIREMGGIPFEFNTIGVDDGIAMGHIGCVIAFHHVKLLRMLLRQLLMRIGLTVFSTFQTVIKLRQG